MTRGLRGLAVATFLGMALLFLSIAVTTGMALAWLMAVTNGALFVATSWHTWATSRAATSPPPPEGTAPRNRGRARAGDTHPRRWNCNIVAKITLVATGSVVDCKWRQL